MEICLVYLKKYNQDLYNFLITNNSVSLLEFDKNDENFKSKLVKSDLIITEFLNDSDLISFNQFLNSLVKKDDESDKELKWLDLSDCLVSTIQNLSFNEKISFVESSILNFANDYNLGMLVLSGDNNLCTKLKEEVLGDFFNEVIYLGEQYLCKFYKNSFLISVAGNAMALAEAYSYCDIKKMDFSKLMEVVDNGAGSSKFLLMFKDLVISNSFLGSNVSIQKLIDEYKKLVEQTPMNLTIVNCFREYLEDLEDKSLGIESIVLYYKNKIGSIL